MTRILRGLALLVVLLTGAAAAVRGSTVAATLGATDKRELQRELRLIIDLLQNYHYADRSFHELEGTEIVARFLNVLDPRGSALTQADGEFVMRRFARSLKSVYLMKGDVQPAFEIFDFFALRSRERLDWVDQRLAREFDFTVEEILSDAAEEKPPADRAEADRRWELRLKDEILDEMLDGRTREAAVTAVRQSYQQWRRQLATMDALVVRERFLEAMVNLFDPHSGYFSAETSREFELEMEGAVAGVGLDLRKEDGRCVVATVRAGGPAEALGEIMPGDQVVAVANGDAPWVPAASKRMRDLVALLRGAPGTKVRLRMAPSETEAGATEREFELERARVILPEERARGALNVVPRADGTTHRIGWIELPAFYAAGEDASAASATRDVRELVTAMQVRSLDALVIDLRKNPGGAITEAVSLTGLFIPPATVLATRGLDGTVTTLQSESTPMLFAGPLVVLTSPASASASEIFAGALRFHRRALVVGGVTTFGKGTVQNYLDLERGPARGTGGPPWGTLRLTAQQFFFPDGASVQGRGAVSHLVLPEGVDAAERREADLPQALRAETVVVSGAAPVTGEFAAVTEELVADLREKMTARAAALPEFELAKLRRELLAEVRAEKGRTLVLETRRQERDARETQLRALRRARWKHAADVAFASELIDTAEVRGAIELQAATMHPRLWRDGGAEVGRVFGPRFWFRDAQGRLGSVGLDAVPWRDFVGEAADLARAFSAASGAELGSEALAEILVEVQLLELVSDRAVRACFARRWTAGGDDAAALVRGVDAVLRRAAEIDGSWLSAGTILDVAGRESIRLASEWADRQAEHTAPAP